MTKPNDTNSTSKTNKKTDVSDNKVEQNDLSETTNNSLKPQSPSPTLNIPVIGALAVAITLGLGIYNVIELRKVSTELQSAQNQHVTTQKSVLNELQSQLQAQQNQSNQLLALQESNKQKFAMMAHELKQLSENSKGNEQTWKLQKTAYLLSMAQLTLHWEREPAPAIDLLSAADTLLKSLDSPLFIGVRQTINNEIIALKALPKLDTVGLLNELNGLGQQIEPLPLKKPTTPDNATEINLSQNSNPDASLPAWKKGLNASLDALSKLIIIRKHQQPYTPLLSQEDKNVVIHQIQLNLRQAQWAVLNQSTELFQLSMNDIEQTLHTYFDDNADNTKSVLAMLDALKDKNISQKLPSIERSYEQIMDIINAASSTQKKGARE